MEGNLPTSVTLKNRELEKVSRIPEFCWCGSLKAKGALHRTLEAREGNPDFQPPGGTSKLRETARGGKITADLRGKRDTKRVF